MNDKQQVYKQKVWEFLEQIQPGETYTVANMCKPKNKELFIECVKEYMRGLPYQGYFSFNGDYSKFYNTPMTISQEQHYTFQLR